MNLCFDRLSPPARRQAEACKIDWASRNDFQSIVARGVELIHSREEAIHISRDDQQDITTALIPFQPHAGEGYKATQAPRGLIYHSNRVGDDGLIADAKIVPPTSQNLAQIEADLRAVVPTDLEHDDVVGVR